MGVSQAEGRVRRLFWQGAAHRRTPTTPLVLRLHLLERLCQLTFAPLCLEGQSGHVLSTAVLYRLLLLPAEWERAKKLERYTCRSVIYMKICQDSTVKCAISVPLASPFGTAKLMFSNRFPDHSLRHWSDNQTTLPQIYGTGWASAAVPGWTWLHIQTEQCFDFKGLVHPKIQILSLITHPHVVSKPVRPSFIIGTQIKIFLMKSESFLTLHRQQRCLLNHNFMKIIIYVNTFCAQRKQKLRLIQQFWNKVFIFVFFVHKKYSCRFVKLRLNHWWHMDYFTNILTTFLGLGTFLFCCCLCRVRRLLD